MAIKFVSFGGGRRSYRLAMIRLKKEIHRLDPDAQVYLFDETDIAVEIEGLDQTFLEFANANPRGFGLWVWKPWLILEVMENAQEGDIVFYLDAGCTVHTSKNSRLRYESYLNHIREHGNLNFNVGQAEFYWTKRETVEHFQLSELELNSGQVMAGVRGHLVNQEQRQFVARWLEACTLDSGRLIRDVDSRINEDERFIEHRHDQSVFSCLAKRNGFVELPDETFFHPKWNRDGDNYPFWTTRKISRIPSWMGYYAPVAVIRGRLKRIFKVFS